MTVLRVRLRYFDTGLRHRPDAGIEVRPAYCPTQSIAASLANFFSGSAPMLIYRFAAPALVLAVLASPAAGQYREHSTWQPLGVESAHDWHLRPFLVSQEPKPPLDTGVVSMQIFSGLGGGLAGAFVAWLPFGLGGLGGEPVASDDVTIVAVLLGYFVGTAAGVQVSSRRLGMRGSWAATLGGAVAGVLGRPLVLFTMPVGATVGFNWTRAYVHPPSSPNE